MRNKIAQVLFPLLATLAIGGVFNSPTALLMGFVFVLFFDHPFEEISRKIIKQLLKIAIVGLGFGMYLNETLATSKDGFLLTLLSIFLTVSLGIGASKLWKLDKKLSYLITSGTAICGGSAIAAISAIIKPNAKTISMALGIVFCLNSIALFIFPPIGHLIGLSQKQFGLWSAIAIHDTSSVVGAALSYGDEALKIATTVKLSRTLWIIPLSFFSIYLFKSKKEKIKIPIFIVGFIIAILINSSGLISESITNEIVFISKRLLILTLFLVGASLSISDLRKAGYKPVLFAIILWVSISLFSLFYILTFS